MTKKLNILLKFFVVVDMATSRHIYLVIFYGAIYRIS
jgi:hypothetical protein